MPERRQFNIPSNPELTAKVRAYAASRGVSVRKASTEIMDLGTTVADLRAENAELKAAVRMMDRGLTCVVLTLAQAGLMSPEVGKAAQERAESQMLSEMEPN